MEPRCWEFMLGCVRPLSCTFDYAQDPSPGSTPRSPTVGSMQPLNRAWSQVGRLALFATAIRDSRSGRLAQRAPTHLLPVAHRAPRPPLVSTRAPTSSGSRTCERNPPQFHPSQLGTTSTALEGGWGGTEICVQQQDLPLRLTPPCGAPQHHRWAQGLAIMLTDQNAGTEVPRLMWGEAVR